MIGHPNVGHVPRETLHSRQGDDLYSRCALAAKITSGHHEISLIEVVPGRTAFHVKRGVSKKSATELLGENPHVHPRPFGETNQGKRPCGAHTRVSLFHVKHHAFPYARRFPAAPVP
jgi:hypothetical protein